MFSGYQYKGFYILPYPSGSATGRKRSERTHIVLTDFLGTCIERATEAL